jgi:hypothetical protein
MPTAEGIIQSKNQSGGWGEGKLGFFVFLPINSINLVEFFFKFFDITKLKLKSSLKGTQKKCHITNNFNSQNLTLDYVLPLF